jgi:hypothetical protein
MKRHLLARADADQKAELRDFFDRNGPLRIAELFKAEVGQIPYAQFLRERFRNRSDGPVISVIIRSQ